MTTDGHTAVRFMDDVALRSLLGATSAFDADTVVRLTMGSQWKPGDDAHFITRAGRQAAQAEADDPAAPPSAEVHQQAA